MKTSCEFCINISLSIKLLIEGKYSSVSIIMFEGAGSAPVIIAEASIETGETSNLHRDTLA